jgi:filamentous hemagglutinin family protein
MAWVVVGLGSIAALGVRQSGAIAQPIPDQTLGGEQSTIRQVNPNRFQIEGGAIRGRNLFHSFREFDVPQRLSVFFDNPADIANILTRVTGTDPSDILGTLGVNGNANLFLMNPNGIVIGRDARLDVAGSFVATTADAMQFGAQGRFSASNPATIPPNLLTIDPSALLYSQLTPPPIDYFGRNQFTNDFAGGSLLLVGGNVNLSDAQLRVRGGRVELAGLAAPGVIGLLRTATGWELVPGAIARANVQLSDGSRIEVDDDGGGDIIISARNINIVDDSRLTAGIRRGAQLDIPAGDLRLSATGAIVINGQISNNTNGIGDAGDIWILADGDLQIIGGSGILSEVNNNGVGRGGDIIIDVNLLQLTSTDITARSSGAGTSGDIVIRADESVQLIDGGRIQSRAPNDVPQQGGKISIETNDLSLISQADRDRQSQITTRTNGLGDSGPIRIRANSLFMLGPGADGSSGITSNTESSGNGGDILIEVTGPIILTRRGQIEARIQPRAMGNGGDITIRAQSLRLSSNSSIDTSTRGPRTAGNIDIQTVDSIQISSASRITSEVTRRSESGFGGDITITTGVLTAETAGSVSSSIRGGTEGATSAGNIRIHADDINLLGTSLSSADEGFRRSSGIFSRTLELAGNEGGQITVDVGRLRITHGAVINAESRSGFSGGDIQIQADEIQIVGGGQILTTAFGAGNAGDIDIQVSGLIELMGVDENFDERVIFAEERLAAGNIQFLSDILANDGPSSGILARTQDAGNAGDIEVRAGRLVVTDGARISAATSGAGQGGNVFIDVDQAVRLSGFSQSDGGLASGIFTTSESGASNQSGNIRLDTPRLSVANSAVISARTASPFAGGSVQVDSDHVRLSQGGQILATALDQGNAGRIILNVNENLDIVGVAARSTADNDGVASGIFARTEAEGAAGNVRVQTNQLRIRDRGEISASTSGSGQGGSLNLAIQELALRTGGQISASTSGLGAGGSIRIRDAEQVSLSGTSNDGRSSGIFTTTESIDGGTGGRIRISTNQLHLFDQAVISARTRSRSSGGNVRVEADTVQLQDGGQIVTTAFRSGNAGSITVEAINDLIISGAANRRTEETDGRASGLFASTRRGGTGGDIMVQANRLEAIATGQISTRTRGEGNAGSISVFVEDEILLAEPGSGFFATTSTNSSGDGGDITVDPRLVVILEGAGIAASSRGTGVGGNVSVQAGILQLDQGGFIAADNEGNAEGGNVAVESDRLLLSNQSSISAATRSRSGGSINLDIRDILALRQSSSLSANAGESGNVNDSGDGGNISIDTAFVVARPDENSDISANATFGNGGRVNITAQGIFGIEFQEAPTNLSDITVSSTFGTEGLVVIDTPDVDPSRGLAELPTEPVNPQLDQSCAAQGSSSNGRFVDVGRGGIPPVPGDASVSRGGWEDLRSPTLASPTSTPTAAASSVSAPIAEAQGWVVNSEGQIALVTATSTTTPYGSWQMPHPCGDEATNVPR